MATATASKVKWTPAKVLAVIREAREHGAACAAAKLDELQRRGPQFAVRDAMAGNRVVGMLLDSCGNAHLRILARGKFYEIAKHLSDRPVNRFYCSRAYHGGGMLSIFDSTRRQEMSVNKAAAEGHAAVLRGYGVEAAVVSYLD